MKRKLLYLLLVVALVLGMTSVAVAGPPSPGTRTPSALPASIEAARLATPLQTAGFALNSKMDASLAGASGSQTVIVRLVDADLAQSRVKESRAAKDKVQVIQNKQQDFLGDVKAMAPGAKVLGSVQRVLNAVFLEIDAAALASVAADPRVARIAPVGNYELDLATTVPYIGAAAAQAEGYTGNGVRVAVLDSGIDYMHIAFGGTGLIADYEANDPTIIEPGSFPTAKVVGGYDFVGNVWAGSGGLLPDPDPLDDGPGGGHGTHVGHIIGGVGGVAPDADLYAVKVCSSVSTACSGVALIQGMEFAVDPNMDGDPADAVDIINMSLGSSYGQPFDDDLSMAVDNATALGVLTVASAGNSADKPFIVGSPSATTTALSVAQTAMPNDFLPLMEVLTPESIAGLYEAVWQPWSAPLTETIEGPLQYGDGAGGNLTGCNPFTADSLAGKIVLVDRGVCSFSIKIANIGDAGGLVGIIGLVAPGDPFTGGYGGGVVTIPGYMISQVDSNTLKSGLAAGVTVRFDPTVGIPLIGTVVGSSSRGPQFENFMVKPEIGAPGASVSAIYGTGTGVGPFGGTSGAAPMVTGSAALLLQAKPYLKPAEAKSMLMNTAWNGVLNEGAGPLAPISRVGGGEVRVDKAIAAGAAAWDTETLAGALSFGWSDITDKKISFTRYILVKNFSSKTLYYLATPAFRYAEDAESGAVTIEVQKKFEVKPKKTKRIPVTITIDGELLSGNFLHSGSGGADPSLLNLMEFDGYINLDEAFSSANDLHVAWHILPRKSAQTNSTPDLLEFMPDGIANTKLHNNGVGMAQIDVYSLLGVSPNMPEGARGEQNPNPDLRAIGIQTYPVPDGYCDSGDGNPDFILALANSFWERTAHANYPQAPVWEIDTNGDGAYDFEVYSNEAAAFASDGRNLSWVYNYATGTSSAYFFTEHAANTGVQVLYVCSDQLGSPAFGAPLKADVFAFDNYFTGLFTDAIEGVEFAPLGERYLTFDPVSGTLFPVLDTPYMGQTEMYVFDFGTTGTNPSELGLLLVTVGDRGYGVRGGATQATEALVVPAQEHYADVHLILGD